jgi:hypothetical protein
MAARATRVMQAFSGGAVARQRGMDVKGQQDEE